MIGFARLAANGIVDLGLSGRDESRGSNDEQPRSRLQDVRMHVLSFDLGTSSPLSAVYLATAAASISGVGGAVFLGSEPLCLSVAARGAPFAIPKPIGSPASSA